MTRAAAPTGTVDVAIIGAGPVGLFLAARLAEDGREVAVFERRNGPSGRTRAIGVHPPGLEAIARIDLADALRGDGLEVRQGTAWSARSGRPPRVLGRVDFASALPDPYRFVLTVPQPATEAHLEARLRRSAPEALHRGVRVVDWTVRPGADGEGGVELRTTGPGAPSEATARLLVACDGAASDVPARLGVLVRETPTGDAYLMADLAANDGPVAPDEDGASIVLHPRGVVEAFPLPGGRRRWVVGTDGRPAEADPELLARRIRERTGEVVDPGTATHPSSFEIRLRSTDRFGAGPVWLAGDAAHVVAPIGGQGMTLGWLGAETLAREAGAWLDGRRPLHEALRRYERAHRPRVRSATARAAWNVRVGRATRFPWLRDRFVRAWLAGGGADRLARTFAMRR